MADQAVNALPTKTTPATGDKVLMIGTAEEYQMLVNDLATAILNKLTSKTFSLDQGTKTLIAALNELNSKSWKIQELQNGDDLDDCTDIGVYASTLASNTYLNAPADITQTFRMEVTEFNATGNRLQKLYVSNGSAMYIRIRLSTGYTGWRKYSGTAV